MTSGSYYAGMKRTTIVISDELALAIESESKRTGRSASAIARHALEEHLGIGPDANRRPGFVALGASGPNNVGEDMEELLRESRFGEPRPR